jgi:alpha-L-arabinofuranosidase
LLTADQMDSHNSFAQPNALMPQSYAAGANGSPLTLDLPPKSVLVVAVAMGQ